MKTEIEPHMVESWPHWHAGFFIHFLPQVVNVVSYGANRGPEQQVLTPTVFNGEPEEVTRVLKLRLMQVRNKGEEVKWVFQSRDQIIFP